MIVVKNKLLVQWDCLCGNSWFRYLSSTLRSSWLHVHYLHAEFPTYFILPFYHSASTIFQNQHLVLKKSARVPQQAYKELSYNHRNEVGLIKTTQRMHDLVNH